MSKYSNVVINQMATTGLDKSALIPFVSCTAGKCFTLHDAVKSLLPEYFPYKSLNNEESSREEDKDEEKVPSENLSEHVESCYPSDDAEVKLVRIQGIEPKLEIPFSWVVNNLVNPEHFLHLCVCLKLPQVKIPSDT